MHRPWLYYEILRDESITNTITFNSKTYISVGAFNVVNTRVHLGDFTETLFKI